MTADASVDAYVGQQLTKWLVQTTLRQPKPDPPKRPYASFLKDFVDPVHPGSYPASINTSVSEWLKCVGSDRGRRCQPDSHLHHSDDLIPTQRTGSAPDMDPGGDAERVAAPPTPASGQLYRANTDAGSVPPSNLTRATSHPSSGKSLVEEPFCRFRNLATNNIYICPRYEPLPEDIANIVESIRQDRDSPGLSLDQVRQVGNFQPCFLPHSNVSRAVSTARQYFKTHLLPALSNY